MDRGIKICVGLMAFIGVPFICFAQTGLASDIHSLQGVLDGIRTTMTPKSKELVNVGKAIAAFASIWFIGSRVWGHIARAESVDVYPLLRPFAIGFAIMNFNLVILVIDGIMDPVVTTTSGLVTDSNNAIAALMQQRQAAMQNSTDWQMYVGPSGSGSEEIWEQKSGDASTGGLSGITNWAKFEMAKTGYNMENSIKVWMSEILKILFEAAALCINTVRTFYLIILSILGPLVFGLSVFDGMHHLIRNWIARYLNIFLWLPVANIFGSIIGQIQEQMIQLDIKQLQATGQTDFGPTDAAYIVFLIMAIVGYFTVPSVANYIIHEGPGGNPHAKNMTDMGRSATSTVTSIPGSTLGLIAGGAVGIANSIRSARSKSQSSGTGETSSNDSKANKIKGNSE